jgi:hypothetical protein
MFKDLTVKEDLGIDAQLKQKNEIHEKNLKIHNLTAKNAFLSALDVKKPYFQKNSAFFDGNDDNAPPSPALNLSVTVAIPHSGQQNGSVSDYKKYTR